MAERLSPNPIGPGIGPLMIGDLSRWETIPRRIVFCTRTPPAYPASLSRVEVDAAGIAYDTIDAGHDAPVSVPQVVAEWLGSIAPPPTDSHGRMDR